MKSNTLVIISTISVVILAILWYFDIVSEPIVAIAGALVPVIGVLIKENSEKKQRGDTKMTVKQDHSGTGDNVGRDKIASSDTNSKQEGNTDMKVEQKHFGKGDNVGRDKISK